MAKKKSTFWSDFKAFISKGNILDMAVGVVIGSAFGKIATALVTNIITPLLSLLVGGLSVEDWKWVIREAVAEVTDPVTGEVLVAGQAETAVTYGVFIQAIIDFLVVAFCIFLILRAITKAQAKLNEKKAAAEAEAAAKAAEEAKAKAAEEEAKAAEAAKLDEDAKRAMIELCAIMKAQK